MPDTQLNDDITAALKRHTARRTRHLFRVPGPENDSHLIAALRGIATSHAAGVAKTHGDALRADHDQALADLEAEHVKARNALRELLTDAGKEITRLKASLEGAQAALTEAERGKLHWHKLHAAAVHDADTAAGQVKRLEAEVERERAAFAQRQDAWDQAKAELKRDLAQARSSIESQMNTIRQRSAEITRLKGELDRYANPGEPPAGDPQPAPAEPAKPARNRARKPAGAAKAKTTGQGNAEASAGRTEPQDAA